MDGFCPLASGSKGNSIYLGVGSTKILIDAGISGRATKNRLAEIDVNLADISAILISHDHIDHIRGLSILALKMGIPVYANVETAKGIGQTLGEYPLFHLFTSGEPFQIGPLRIHPFTVLHDTVDPVAFTIEFGNIKVGICTDLGEVTPEVQKQLTGCHYLYVEANHVPEWVHACPRPARYKERVLGPFGHLSNRACGELLCSVAGPQLQHAYLAHLSSECNSHEAAITTVQQILASAGIALPTAIALQDSVSEEILFPSHHFVV